MVDVVSSLYVVHWNKFMKCDQSSKLVLSIQVCFIFSLHNYVAALLHFAWTRIL